MVKREKLKPAILFENLLDDAQRRVEQLIIGSGQNSGTELIPFSQAALWCIAKARILKKGRQFGVGQGAHEDAPPCRDYLALHIAGDREGCRAAGEAQRREHREMATLRAPPPGARTYHDIGTPRPPCYR